MGLRKVLARGALKITGWTITVDCELPSKGVLVGAPHTSQWDWVLMMALFAETGVKARWLGKSGLFWWPLGPLLRAWGGIPVDRASSHGLVEQVAATLENNPGTFIALTPEGTRSGPKYWKSGFYRIAQEAQVPLVLGYVDGPTKTVGLTKVYNLTGNVTEDMDVIRDFYRGKTGVKPGRTKEPRLREEDNN